MADKKKSGPRWHEDRSGTQQGANDSFTVQTELPLRHPVAHVSLYAPHKGRRTWWFAFKCPACGFGHQGNLTKATDEDSAHRAVMGVRRARCGKRVWLVVARTYRGSDAAEAVA